MKIQQKVGYHHGRLKETLVDVALHTIKEKGTANLSLRQLAQTCGVSQSAPYRHFNNKEHLIAVLIENGYNMLAELAKKSFNETNSPQEKLKNICMTYINFALKNATLFNLMLGPTTEIRIKYPFVQEACDQCFKVLIDAMSNYSGDKEKPHQSELMSLAAWSLTHGIAVLMVNGQFHHAKTKKEREVLANDIVDEFIRNIR